MEVTMSTGIKETKGCQTKRDEGERNEPEAQIWVDGQSCEKVD